MTGAALEEEAALQPARWIVVAETVEPQRETRVAVVALTGSGIRELPPVLVPGAHLEVAVAAAHLRGPAVLVVPPAWDPAGAVVAVAVVVVGRQNFRQGRMRL